MSRPGYWQSAARRRGRECRLGHRRRRREASSTVPSTKLCSFAKGAPSPRPCRRGYRLAKTGLIIGGESYPGRPAASQPRSWIIGFLGKQTTAIGHIDDRPSLSRHRIALLAGLVADDLTARRAGMQRFELVVTWC